VEKSSGSIREIRSARGGNGIYVSIAGERYVAGRFEEFARRVFIRTESETI
jgi:hypothetical protein